MLLDNNSPRLTTPPNTLIKLKNHQQAMLYKMTQIEKISNIGIMSDYPGSGKSFVILSLILWDTTDIILLHKSLNQQQIIGRAQRPGRTTNLNIHCLLYENENE